MAISVNELAVHLRISAHAGQSLNEPDRTIVSQLHNWAQGEIENRTEDAPEHAVDMAVILLAGYRYDAPTSAAGARFANAWENSGAANVLRKWTKRRGIVLA